MLTGIVLLSGKVWLAVFFFCLAIIISANRFGLYILDMLDPEESHIEIKAAKNFSLVAMPLS